MLSDWKKENEQTNQSQQSLFRHASLLKKEKLGELIKIVQCKRVKHEGEKIPISKFSGLISL
jgi:hypothetical protein